MFVGGNDMFIGETDMLVGENDMLVGWNGLLVPIRNYYYSHKVSEHCQSIKWRCFSLIREYIFVLANIEKEN